MRKLFGISIICALLTGPFHASLGVVHEITVSWDGEVPLTIPTINDGDSIHVKAPIQNCWQTPSVFNTLQFQTWMGKIDTKLSQALPEHAQSNLQKINIELTASVFPLPSNWDVFHTLEKKMLQLTKGERYGDFELPPECCLYPPKNEFEELQNAWQDPRLYDKYVKYYKEQYYEKITGPVMPVLIEAIAPFQKYCEKLTVTMNHECLTPLVLQELQRQFKENGIQLVAVKD